MKERMNNLTHLEQRALAGYFRFGGSTQPGNVETVEHDGRSYVRLTSIEGVLAVYRVRRVPSRAEAMLKKLRRWPAALEIN